MICPQCQKQNREQAHYCKWCGSALSNDNTGPLADLVGMDKVKKQLMTLVARYEEHQRRMKTTGVSQPSPLISLSVVRWERVRLCSWR